MQGHEEKGPVLSAVEEVRPGTLGPDGAGKVESGKLGSKRTMGPFGGHRRLWTSGPRRDRIGHKGWGCSMSPAWGSIPSTKTAHVPWEWKGAEKRSGRSSHPAEEETACEPGRHLQPLNCPSQPRSVDPEAAAWPSLEERWTQLWRGKSFRSVPTRRLW